MSARGAGSACAASESWALRSQSPQAQKTQEESAVQVRAPCSGVPPPSAGAPRGTRTGGVGGGFCLLLRLSCLLSAAASLPWFLRLLVCCRPAAAPVHRRTAAAAPRPSAHPCSGPSSWLLTAPPRSPGFKFLSVVFWKSSSWRGGSLSPELMSLLYTCGLKERRIR